MQNTAPLQNTLDAPLAAPWALRAWPPLLWQAARARGLRLQHLGTRITSAGDPGCGTAGQTMWAGHFDDGEAGVAWDWVQISEGVVAMADPLAVVTNLRLIGNEGEVLTAMESALYLNELVHALPWQHEVTRALVQQ